MKNVGKKSRKLKDIPVKKKLNCLTIFLMSALLLLGIMSAAALSILNLQTKQISTVWMPSLSMAQEMNLKTSDYRIQQYRFLTAESQEAMDEAESLLQEIEQGIVDTSEEYEKNLISQEDKELLDAASECWDSYKEKSEEVRTLIKSGKTSEANDLLVGEASVYYNQFQDNFDELVNFNAEGSEKAAKNAETLFVIVVIIIIFILVCSIGTAFKISRKVAGVILEPLQEVGRVLREIGSGNLDDTISYESEDEFGILASEVNSFVLGLNAIITDEKILLGEMAKGNFNIISSETQRYVGGFAPILISMRDIKQQLGSALSRIQEAGYQIDSASDQLATQAQELASGASEQASTVEELAASIEELTNQAISNTQGTEQAASMAKDVQNQVVDSNHQMKRAVDAMNVINQTSNEISTIIEAIENIASQTNLLSLNASIEAARAGEAGRGFAVVASEIGSLAQECSEAASNTRKLIEKSVSQTENGNGIVTQTAEALERVNEQVIRVVEIVETAKENSKNQENSMREVEQGVGIISRVVETNSASAQECSATSEELSANAETLKEQLAKFQFEG